MDGPSAKKLSAALLAPASPIQVASVLPNGMARV
jgi:hypothetical protein